MSAPPATPACTTLADFLHQKVQRTCDVLARYGGEEFVVLLINNTQGDALDVAEALRADITTLVADAYKALYLAKHHGCNCVRAAVPRITTPQTS